jgi:hypothetical protein
MLPNRTYFFNVKENRMGDLYLNFVESKNREDGGFDRQSVILFADDLQEFLKGFDESLRFMEKEVRERRRSARTAAPSASARSASARSAEKSYSAEKPHSAEKPRKERPFKERPSRERPPKKGKRIVVKKGKHENS